MARGRSAWVFTMPAHYAYCLLGPGRQRCKIGSTQARSAELAVLDVYNNTQARHHSAFLGESAITFLNDFFWMFALFCEAFE
jgi:hypothetical protein